MSKTSKSATKAELHAALAEKTGLTKKQVAGFMDKLVDYIKRQVGDKGVFELPGLQVVRHKKTRSVPARKRHQAGQERSRLRKIISSFPPVPSKEEVYAQVDRTTTLAEIIAGMERELENGK